MLRWMGAGSAAIVLGCGGGASAEGLRADDVLAALVERDGRIVAVVQGETGEGRSLDVELGRGLGTDAAAPLVDLGSITKFVTAVMVLHLVDGGQLSLDARLGDLLPGVPEDKAGISVHHLLTHTAGLAESTGSDGEALDRATFLRRVLRMPLIAAPGEGYRYSNAGYSVLAALVETVSGLDYEAYLLERVLAPGGLPPMGYGAVYEAERSVRSGRMLRTAFRRQGIEVASWGGSRPGWNLIGNGGLVATAEGFLGFWRAFLDGEIVSDGLVARALTPFVDEGGGESHYGYGLVVEVSPDHGTVYWHDGGNEVFSAEWRHFADRGLSVVVAGIGDDAFDAMAAVMRSGS